ncbi:FAS1-like dehydratase domain-containing protein [Ramlibacter sp.]|uniref:FAS1-like dehydratase domain-containing protein n=1 Tax=Ramlibacter sp. TaxID=1917967 RepID=UPI002C47C0F6|nr:MaoC family dehydratase N-terminal domain-containing protein [Ramlibacter sp.]HWI84361.1 MaoC family dehydratase N-terminal domain-containing protein [Ramlibacter sp.]
MTLDTQQLMAWKGRQEVADDLVTAAPPRLLRATLDLPPDDGATQLPALWHWLFFLPSPRQSALGPDGHARRGGFLPPVPLPRRMWAGGQLEFLQPLRLGDALRRESTIDDIQLKPGRTGTLCFVRVRHEISGPRGPALREFHDIVYRDLPAPGGAAPRYEDAPAGEVGRRVTPDDVLLFRYSALTFNGHRIHYDRRYVTEVEGYPGLVVHGPLMATLLAGLGEREFAGRAPATFSFRALKPVFDLHPFDVCGERDGEAMNLWIRDHEGHRAMTARMAFGR